MKKGTTHKDRFAERDKTYFYRWMVFCLLVLFLVPYASAASGDSIYMGTQVKLDIASPIVVPAANRWQMQNYEIAVNVRLAKRWYPTAEIGYAGGTRTVGDSIFYRGHGGFFRIGGDLNPLKKHPERPHALLVGVRFGTAVQEMEQRLESDRRGLTTGVRADCWGEIVAGCQVEIAEVNQTAFYMGWMGRFKVLFTRAQADAVKPAIAPEGTVVNVPAPVYIPGFGNRNNIGWGVNYYLGWRF